MTDDREIDRMLDAAGQAWRSQNFPRVELRASDFKNEERGRRVASGLALSAIAVAVLVVMLPRLLPDSGPSATSIAAASSSSPATTTEPSQSPTYSPSPRATETPHLTPSTSAPTSFPHDAVVEIGSYVMAPGRIIGSNVEGRRSVLCYHIASLGETPACEGQYSPILLDDVDVLALPGGQHGETWITDNVVVRGTWTGESIQVDSVQPIDEPPPMAGPPVVPCVTPPGGWPGNADVESQQTALENFVQDHPDTYVGSWVATSEDSDDLILVVGTTLDVEEATAQLERLFTSNLCIVHMQFSATDLQMVLDALSPVVSAEMQLDPAVDRVAIWPPVVDQSLFDAVGPHIDEVDLRPAAVKIE